jgi:hypothetical protein
MREPEPIGGSRYNVNTPEGKIESIGKFARGLGPRRIKIGAGVIAVAVMLVAVLAAL